MIILSILTFILDRVLKSIIFDKIPVGSSLPVIQGVFHITPTFNKGIAFGLLKDFNLYILIAVSFAAALSILYVIFVKKPGSPLFVSGLYLILGGAVSNMLDRVAYGHVLDFLDFRIWPVFNIADSAITVGAGLVLWHLLIIGRK
ncbi:MAG: signal peptidase II [Candidatus Omnitrophota bacterium]